jgi:WD40 repeat protein
MPQYLPMDSSATALTIGVNGVIASGTQVGKSSTVKFYDGLHHCESHHPSTGHRGKITALDLSLRGEHLAIGTDQGEVRVVQICTGNHVYAANLGRSINALALSPDVKMLAVSAQGDEPRLLRIPRPHQPVPEYLPARGNVQCFKWSPDSQWLAVAGDQSPGLSIINAGDNWKWHDLSTHGGAAVWSAAWSPCGSRLASGNHYQDVHVWEKETAKRLSGASAWHSVKICVAYAGEMVVSADVNGLIQFHGPEGDLRSQINKAVTIHAISGMPGCVLWANIAGEYGRETIPA